MIREQDRSIVVVGAHGPAIEGAGGVAAKCAELGKDVTFVCLSRSVLRDPEVQMEEQRKVSKAIGAKNTVFLDFRDTQIQDTIELRHALVRVFRENRADVVITESDQNPHPDAWGAAKASHAASCHASLEAVLPEVKPIHLVQAVYSYPGYAFGLGFKPEVYVDITDVAEKKWRVLNMYRGREVPLDEALVREKVWGLQSGVQYAEAFTSFWASHLGVRALTVR